MSFRGSTIHFAATFTGADGQPATPTSAKVTLKFKPVAGGPGSVSLDLANSSGVWKASWDSSVAKPGLVAWSVRATDGSEIIVGDDVFTLSANAANAPPAP
jgi:hypothetical protein